MVRLDDFKILNFTQTSNGEVKLDFAGPYHRQNIVTILSAGKFN